MTVYDSKPQLLMENPINRYLISSPMLRGMKKNADGSLTLYIQNNHWVLIRMPTDCPAPEGRLYIVMRLYWPKTEPPSVLPPGSRL